MSQPPQQPGQPWGQNQPANPQNPGPYSPQQQAPDQYQSGPAGQYPNQPGAAAAAGQYPAQAGQVPGEPGVPPAKPSFFKTLGGRIVTTLLAIAVAIGLYFGWNAFQAGQDRDKLAALVNKCVTLTGSSDNVDYQETDCNAGFNYLVTASIDAKAQCPTSDYQSITTERRGRRGSKTEVGKICLIPNLKDGKCYSKVPGNEIMPFKEEDCGTAEFKIKVLQENAPGKCEDPKSGFGYPEPARTFCISLI